ncbi:hypothetical protein EYF80_063756 [Liparis tanakae]|uniref:Uncharacterized protein n=1 Tax=Liparis tanakae TaxID=230148 RepID=A0A4Z2EBC2_9TELE|nr:hypothetical protein EYF80_063756 [Liparis tanakae]
MGNGCERWQMRRKKANMRKAGRRERGALFPLSRRRVTRATQERRKVWGGGSEGEGAGARGPRARGPGRGGRGERAGASGPGRAGRGSPPTGKRIVPTPL